MNTGLSSIFSPSELLVYIEFLRERLIGLGLKNGFSCSQTIQASQELDFFIFEYQKMKL
ncbi:aspartyl-phosphate phosphatase Spo0E family protein [Mesobacillus campisalis]|uniref:aspartyl-phosphate phosphatase Spo0E family protein n=1 Tax=Mesobacillus campisalis TaxID=1408103 RepID=UPI000A07D9BB|nr:aspartyl-phosphate phosphatase Spo0E family protein [Mesobacillus campisalis]